MSNVKPFCLAGDTAIAQQGSASDLGKPLQTLNEQSPSRSLCSSTSKEISHA